MSTSLPENTNKLSNTQERQQSQLTSNGLHVDKWYKNFLKQVTILLNRILPNEESRKRLQYLLGWPDMAFKALLEGEQQTFLSYARAFYYLEKDMDLQLFPMELQGVEPIIVGENDADLTEKERDTGLKVLHCRSLSKKNSRPSSVPDPGICISSEDEPLLGPPRVRRRSLKSSSDNLTKDSTEESFS